MASLPSPAAAISLVNTSIVEHEFQTMQSSFIPAEKMQGAHYKKGSAMVSPIQKTSFPQRLEFREAFSLLVEGKELESGVYVPLLQECLARKSVFEAQALQARMIKTGIHENLFLSTFMINVYAKCGRMEYARRMFDNMPQRNVVTWTALMTGYTHNSQPMSTARVYCEMLESGAYPTNYTLGTVLSACFSLNDVNFGRQIHGFSVKYGIEDDISVANALCSFYSKTGCIKSGLQVFQRMPEKNVISWTTIISAVDDNGEPEMGLQLFGEMLTEGVEPNEFTLTSVLGACCVMQALDVGKQLHGFIIKIGLETNAPVRNSIMYMYLKNGEIEDSHKLLDNMDEMSLITWNKLIAGHAQMMDRMGNDLSAHHSGLQALRIFQKMNRSTTNPDLFTFSSVISVCSKLVGLEQGEQIHAQTIKTGFITDVVVGSAVVNMYSKCGSIEKASRAFVEMPTRTLISWTSMITGFAQHGRCHEALHLFEEMRLAGVRPNKVTFVGVLSACSHAGLVDDCLKYFDMMKREYGINPVMDHYACVIDMFVRIGELDKASTFVREMEIEPNEFIWSILLAGCRSHGNMDLGFVAAERLLELKPKDTEIYFMLLNTYLQAERWKDLSRVRKIMKEEKIVKLQDWSWISIKGVVYSFRANDRSLPQTVYIHEYLENLLKKSKEMGYIAEKNAEIAEDEEDEQRFVDQENCTKECVATYHSELLAVAFGLINVQDGASIRIIKNIRMCRDCHSVIKTFSIITQREIIVRDGKRLHQFRNGVCSCGDFGGMV
ncbi:pentatricopeptide repeat-containing protein At3g24000, mitochondrial-like isoform X1 [Nymphaea colorata]|nr:pentatricopeptide repeat-containing protein At3g24000, mitochondrial-like isoform X1 [Nymphaea colorata]